MITTGSGFVGSTIEVNQNAVKSILFRCAALLLQFAVYKVFSFLAFKSKAFTSYLMFAEDYIQKGFFIASRGFTRGAVLVLTFAIFFAGAGLYDTLLWGLDAPGYIAHKSNVTAASLANRRLDSPTYVVSFTSGLGETDLLDREVTDVIGANLFKPSVNFTLTGKIDRGHPAVVPATRAFNPSLAVPVGPRIWLDAEGLSVSPDTYVAFANGPGMDDVSKTFNCPWTASGTNGSNWACPMNNSYALSFAQDGILGQPEVHWDDVSDLSYRSAYMKPKREDNPWASLGKGGSTALMKQMFTVTKGRERHTFIETAIKASLLMDYSAPFPQDEVTDLVKRIWSPDPAEQQNPLINTIATNIGEARQQNMSYTLGWNEQSSLSVSQVQFELLNVEGAFHAVIYTLLRISVVNITLIRSDTLAEPVQPPEQCNKPFQSEATGGRVFGTDCATSAPSNDTSPHFFGQVDTSTVFILNGLLGTPRATTSAKALDQRGFEWIIRNGKKLDNLLLSRGFIMTADPALVTVEVSRISPALSYLQIFLSLLAAFLAALAWILLGVAGSPHYASSLLANLYATTDVGGSAARRKPEYISNIPEIRLRESAAGGGAAVMETPMGVFRHEPYGGGAETETTAVAATHGGDSSSLLKPDKRGSTSPHRN